MDVTEDSGDKEEETQNNSQTVVAISIGVYSQRLLVISIHHPHRDSGSVCFSMCHNSNGSGDG